MDYHCLRFLKNEFLSSVILGSLGRSGTYSDSASENDTARLRDELRKKLREISDKYKSDVSEGTHILNIEELADTLTNKFKDILKNGRFRIGVAQKALNLYLKYLWCLGIIPRPPHCPFDSIVIQHLSGCTGMKWTKIDNIGDYQKLVDEAKRVANGKSLSEWELEIWESAKRDTPVVGKANNKALNRDAI